MTQETQPGDLPRVARFVDLRIPLWGLLCCGAAAAYFIIGTWFTSNQTAKDVSDLQITVKAGNQQVTTLAGEQALLRFRMDNLDGEIRAIKAQLALMSSQPQTQPQAQPARRP